MSLIHTLIAASITLGATGGALAQATVKTDHNLGVQWFAFGGLELERNRFANLQLRSLSSGGLGYHALKTPTTSRDLFGGLRYTSDHFIDPMVIDGANRSAY